MARLTRTFHVDETAIRARLLELRSGSRRQREAQLAQSSRGAAMTPHETELFEIMALHPDLARRYLGGYMLPEHTCRFGVL